MHSDARKKHRLSGCPTEIDGARVIASSVIDDRHVPTGNCLHKVSGGEMVAPHALAICQYADDDGVYLFYCDREWTSITDTCHSSIEDAKSQAEFEFNGIKATWQSG